MEDPLVNTPKVQDSLPTFFRDIHGLRWDLGRSCVPIGLGDVKPLAGVGFDDLGSSKLEARFLRALGLQMKVLDAQ